MVLDDYCGDVLDDVDFGEELFFFLLVVVYEEVIFDVCESDGFVWVCYVFYLLWIGLKCYCCGFLCGLG